MSEVGTTQSAELGTPAALPLVGDAPAFLYGPHRRLRSTGRRLVTLGGLLLACGFFVRIDGCIGTPSGMVVETWTEEVRNVQKSGVSWPPIWRATEIMRVAFAPFVIGLLIAMAAISRRRPGRFLNRAVAGAIVLAALWTACATLPLSLLEPPAVEWGLFDRYIVVRVLLGVVFPLLLLIYAVRARRRLAEFELGLTLLFAVYQFAWWLLFQITESRTWNPPWECGAFWNFVSAGFIAIGAFCELLGASGSNRASWRALLHGVSENSGELLCRECQYNLRGLTGTRCPECGADIVAPRSAAS